MSDNNGGPIEFNFGSELAEDNTHVREAPITVPITTHVTVNAATPRPPFTSREPAQATPKDIVKFAKERLKAVKREIAAKKALEKERDELERLIAAAEGSPKKSPKTKASKQ